MDFNISITLLVVIVFISLLQSIFGVGILLFGTPILLSLGYGFTESLYTLLPLSLIVNLIQIVPNYKFVVAVDGDPDRVLSDKFWQTLWLGGTFNEIEYDALINQGIFDDYYTTYNHPYSAIARQYLTNPSAIGNYMNISYEYNSYFSNYQPYASGIETERYLPNMYLNTWAYLFTTGAGDYMSNVYNFVSCDEKIENPPGNLANAAIYLLEPEILDLLQSMPDVYDFDIDILPKLLGKIATWENTSVHRDIGSIEELLNAQKDSTMSFEFEKRDSWQSDFDNNSINKELIEFNKYN